MWLRVSRVQLMPPLMPANHFSFTMFLRFPVIK
jgi:hypothetical protein